MVSKNNKEKISYTLKNHYLNNIVNNINTNIIGILNFYLDNKIMIYHRNI